MNPRTKARSASDARYIPSRGLALVTVLWVLVLPSLIAASFTATTRTEINLTRNLIENVKAEALSDAGIHRAIYALLSPKSEAILSPQILDIFKLSSDPAAARRRVERDLRSELGETFFPEIGDPKRHRGQRRGGKSFAEKGPEFSALFWKEFSIVLELMAAAPPEAALVHSGQLSPLSA